MLRRIPPITALLLLSSLSTSPSAYAEWTPLGPAGAILAPTSDGAGAIISFDVAAGAQKRDSTGTLLWSTSLNITTPSGGAPDGSGGVVYAANPGATSIVASRVSTSGSLPWGNSVTVGAGTYPAVATDAAGNSYFAWRNGTNTQVLAQKLNPSGTPQWQAGGLPITTVGININTTQIAVVSDESGGCFVVWRDLRNSGTTAGDLYMQRVLSNGAVAWAANGIPLCNLAGEQQDPSLIADQAGGMIAVWADKRGADKDLYAQRVDQTGAALWAPNGAAIATAACDQFDQAMISDGSGGAFLTWTDCRTYYASGNDIYAQRIDSNGAAQWTANGVLVCSNTGDQALPRLTTDGAGGIIVGWINPTPFVQRLSGAGAALWATNGVEVHLTLLNANLAVVTDGGGGAFVLGRAPSGSGAIGRILPTGEPAWVRNWRPTISSIADVPLDEGGWVRVNISRPPFADIPNGNGPLVNGYSVWREQQTTAGAARLTDPRHLLPSRATPSEIGFPPGSWEAVGYLPAMQRPTYTLIAPTYKDSTAGGSGDENFIAIAHTTTSTLYLSSPIVAAHSVDNLAPGAPQSLTGGLIGPTSVEIHWAPGRESDLWHYSVYKGTSPSFVPSAANRLGQPTGTSFQDDAYEPGISHYKVSATDRHDNESSYSLLPPSQITSVPPGTMPARTFLGHPSPNPFRAETSIEYGVASEGPVSLAVYDLRGRLVARLVEGNQTPGVRRAVWNGLDEGHHRAQTGVFWVRMKGVGFSGSEKMVRVD
jgi:hypothetical protein